MLILLESILIFQYKESLLQFFREKNEAIDFIGDLPRCDNKNKAQSQPSHQDDKFLIRRSIPMLEFGIFSIHCRVGFMSIVRHRSSLVPKGK